MWFAKWFGGRTTEEDDEPAQHAPPPIAVVRPNRSASLARAKAAPPKGKGFDPYNSGAFERRNAWERVNRR